VSIVAIWLLHRRRTSSKMERDERVKLERQDD
jgi:hypothetical protein